MVPGDVRQGLTYAVASVAVRWCLAHQFVTLPYAVAVGEISPTSGVQVRPLPVDLARPTVPGKADRHFSGHSIGLSSSVRNRLIMRRDAAQPWAIGIHHIWIETSKDVP